MRITILAIACGFGLVSAGAALADQPDAQPVLQKASAVSDPNPVICHTFVHEGVLLGRGVCHTRHEWDAIRFREQQSIREFQLRNLDMH